MLDKGGNVAISGRPLQLQVTGPAGRAAPDLVVLAVQPDGRVRSDADLIFFNQPESSDGAVRLTAAGLSIDPARVSTGIDRLVVAVALDSPLLSHDELHLSVLDQASSHELVISGLAGERAVMLGEVYRREGRWKLRNVGQGYAAGLAGLARAHGVVVDDEPAAPNPTPVVRPLPSSVPSPAPPRVAMPLTPWPQHVEPTPATTPLSTPRPSPVLPPAPLPPPPPMREARPWFKRPKPLAAAAAVVIVGAALASNNSDDDSGHTLSSARSPSASTPRSTAPLPTSAQTSRTPSPGATTAPRSAAERSLLAGLARIDPAYQHAADTSLRRAGGVCTRMHASGTAGVLINYTSSAFGVAGGPIDGSRARQIIRLINATTCPGAILTTHPTRQPLVPTVRPTTTPTAPVPIPIETDVYYANCTEARAAGAAPIYRGDPGYSSKLDRDGDGVACE
ncbi:MAG: TerD family protein [Jatrophihabitans sp.]|uniref:TerD family protein n=1 Tax=Jatrophihabitans sp. TaxID=1932789 RepID=UPI003F7E9E03